MTMQEGTHVYGRFTEDQAFRAAVARDNLMTLEEAMASQSAKRGPMEVAPDGALVPAQTAGRMVGWEGDRSHVEGRGDRLIGLMRRIQEHSDAITEAIRTGENTKSLAAHGLAMRNLWNRYMIELERQS